MRKTLLVVLALVMVAVCASWAFAAEEKKAEKEGADQGAVLYVCTCGPDCKCNTVLTKPGKCACGQDLVPRHVLKIEKGEALLCTCGKGCTCKFNPADPTKCGCGKPVKKVSLKGLYVCDCGPECNCNTVSDQPGKCKCGKEMKKVE